VNTAGRDIEGGASSWVDDPGINLLTGGEAVFENRALSKLWGRRVLWWV